MIGAFLLSVRQLGDRRILRVLAQSLALTLALFTVLGVAAWWGMQGALQAWLGDRSGGVAAILALSASVLALWFVFRAVAVAILFLFADDIVAAVERRHYPDALASGRRVALHRSAAMGLGSAARVTLVNLVMLPVYIALLVTGVGTAAAFFLVNGWLLGRDLFDMVAARHLGGAAMRAARKANRATRFLLGLAVTALLVVPVVGLLAPVIGAAMATHLFHRRGA